MLAYLPDLRLHYRLDGPNDGPVLVLNHALGLNLSMWDAVVALLPPGLRILRYDHRGHGGSDVPPAPYSMGALIHDAERLLDHLGIRDCVYLGVSMGGLVAQGLAVKRLDLVRALVLSNTAAKIGTPWFWRDAMAVVQAGGLGAIHDGAMQALFSPGFRAGPDFAHWEGIMRGMAQDGWLAPPDLVRETGDLIRGGRFHLIRGAGHFPMIEAPGAFAAVLTDFLRSIGHV